MEGKSAGSLQPISKGDKWHSEIDGAGLATLTGLAKDINKTIDQTVKVVARAKIKVGKLLLEARKEFQSDVAFGQWRKAETSIQSKQHAHYLMQVATKFANATVLIEGASYSVIQELVLATPEDISWVEDRIEAGDPPTVVETREKVRETKGLPPAGKKGTSKKAAKEAGTLSPDVGTSAGPNMAINQIVQLNLPNRIKQVIRYGIKGIEGDFIILGMDPDPQTPCHPLVLDGILQTWLDESEGDDERRAVVDSHRRVEAEFKNWHMEM